MTTEHDDERTGIPGTEGEAGGPAADREAAADRSREAGRVPDPSPEEAPELLGERSDYPIAWDPGDDES